MFFRLLLVPKTPKYPEDSSSGIQGGRNGIHYPDWRMCGRFARKSTQEVLADWFGVELEDMPWFAPSYNVAPQSGQPVVRLSRGSGGREIALMRWGLVP